MLFALILLIGQTQSNPALDNINTWRAAFGKAPVVWDTRLEAAAKQRAIIWQSTYPNHVHSLPNEIYAFGFPKGPPPSDFYMKNDYTWGVNVSEGGLSEVWESVSDCAKMYCRSCFENQKNEPNDGHMLAFKASWTHVGAARYGKHFVIIFGYLKN
jgi:hypothetical protein